MMCWAIALKSATSVPGLICKCTVASLAGSVVRGSMTMSLVPFLTARFIQTVQMMGWACGVLLPTSNNT